jgi:hypothetical protein
MLAGEIVKIKPESVDKYPHINRTATFRVDPVQGSAQKDETAIAIYNGGNYRYTVYIKSDDIEHY